MRENKLYISNKSFVVMKYSLLAAVLIGLVIFTVFNILPKPVHAEEECNPSIQGGVDTCNPECQQRGYSSGVCTYSCTGTDIGKDFCITCTGSCCCYSEDDCDDGVDNDGDGKIDCADEDCEGEYCGECKAYGCQYPYFFEFLSGYKTCNSQGECSSETCDYDYFCADKDLDDGWPGDPISCNADCDGYGEECLDYCEGDTLYEGECDVWPGDCTCDYDTKDCNDDDGCWVYGNGCEERDYFCSEDNSAFCDYTYSNRNTDSYGDWVYYCSDNQLKKHKLKHDFYCDGDSCTDHTSWVDDQLVQNCYYKEYYCEGDDVWYEEGYCENAQCKYDTHFSESCNNDYEYCSDDERWDYDEFCVAGSCDYEENLIEDCSANNYDECQDTYYKHHYTETCHETDGVTQCLPASSLVDCRDQYWCDGQEYCEENAGVYCADGTPVDCDDENICTYDNCIEDGSNTGHCENPHKDIYPPETEKWYVGPYKYGSGPEEWINSLTEVWMSAEDQGPEGLPQCTVGLDKILYKDIYLEDEEDWHYCSEDCEEWVPNDYEDEGWVEYFEPFHKEPESCHIIEYYSVDNLGNKEIIDWQCVFVDNSAPTPEKTVGEPKAKWDGSGSYFYPDETVHCWDGTEDEIECWKVITETPITMSCVDPEPHPVGFKELCYRVERNGVDLTDEYCDPDLKEGWCCIGVSSKELYFKEDCEHELEFYCVDELDNESPLDIEKFKVGGEKFEIQLNPKWNLISTPIILLNGDPEVVFKDIKDKVLVVLTYDAEDPDCVANDGWCVYIPKTDAGTIKEIKPGWGYWVLTNDEAMLTVVGSLWKEGETPPSRSLVEGWNLIGYYGTDGLDGYYEPVGGGKQAFCALHSLVNLENPNPLKWDALITYWNGFYPYPDGYSSCDKLDPGAGYWIGMISSDPDYRWSSDCSGNTCD